MQQQSAAQNVQSLINQLNSALLRKHGLEAEIKQLDEQVVAFRNILAGIELGKTLHQEVAAEKAARDAVASNREAPTVE